MRASVFVPDARELRCGSRVRFELRLLCTFKFSFQIPVVPSAKKLRPPRRPRNDDRQDPATHDTSPGTLHCCCEEPLPPHRHTSGVPQQSLGSRKRPPSPDSISVGRSRRHPSLMSKRCPHPDGITASSRSATSGPRPLTPRPRTGSQGHASGVPHQSLGSR